MSYTELYAVKKNGDVTLYDEVHNANRGATSIWAEMVDKYIGKNIYPMCMITGDMQQVWDLVNDKAVPKLLRIALATTFDNVIVKKENFTRAIEALEEFCLVFGKDSTNLPLQIEIIKQMKEDEEVIGLAWNQTSVNGDAWEYWNGEEEEETIPYNINKGNSHWSLFAEEETTQ